MAASAVSSSDAQSLLVLLISTCLLLPLSQAATTINSAAVHPPFSFSFDFTNQSSYNSTDLLHEGSASVHSDRIDLSCNSLDQNITYCVGRVSYHRLVPLYDDTTLASFNTSFTFVISVDDNTTLADGIAFFLSGYPSSVPLDSSGGNLGLLSGNEPAAYGAGQFVAVEFDTYSNWWDPPENHIGIDLNTVRSGKTTTTCLPNGQNLSGNWTATIKFDNTTTTLSASLRSNHNSSMEPVVVSQVLPDPRTFLPPQVAVGFSASTGYKKEVNQILAWSFNSTIAAPPSPHKGQKATNIVGGVLALLLVVVMAWFILSCWKWRNRHPHFEKHEPTRFEYRDLAAATDHFSEEKKLGEGYFGVVYIGNLKKLGREVAVKMILDRSNVMLGPKDKDFYAELNTVTLVNHKNLVKLVGWCRGNRWNFFEFMCWCWNYENNNKLFLVYELVPNGSLHDHLHKVETLPWETRYKIVKGITCALVYLHHECDPLILHRDIKPSNILLDNNFNAKLADFGLSRIVDPDSSWVLTLPVGTVGYLDPQCMKSVGMVEFNRSSDVYSYGIVLLEIACRKGMTREKVWQQYLNRSLMQAADDKLKGEFRQSEMENVIILGLWCSYPDSKKRPSMEQVMFILEHGRPLPDLNSLDATSVVSTQQETHFSSAGSSSYEQLA